MLDYISQKNNIMGKKIAILGAGPSGSILAISLARMGYMVEIYDPCSIDSLTQRTRAYALTHSSRRLLQSLDLWNTLESKTTPFSKLVVSDQVIKRSVNFGIDVLSLNNSKFEAMGWIIDHRDLMTLLLKIIESSDHIKTEFASNINNDFDSHDFIVAADGPMSPWKKTWGINSHEIQTNTSCLTAKILIRGIPSSTAFEIFRSEGPLAILPMGGDLYQIVWSSSKELCDRRVNLDKALLLDNLAAILPSGFEPDAIIDQPSAFQVSFSISFPLHKNYRVLVGESGHRFHPVGGQGLNVCWRDVQLLSDLLERAKKNRFISANFPVIYTLNRTIDLILIGLSTLIVIRLFSNKNKILLFVRRIIFNLLKNLKLFRTLAMRIFTDGIISVFVPQ